MKWLSNIYDPNKEDAKMYVTPHLHQTQQEAWIWYLKWLHGKIIGEPKETETYTVEQLKAMGMVGVYSKE